MPLLRRFRARRAAGQGTIRLANSVRIPWALGLFALLALAIGTILLVGQASEHDFRVPQALLDYQEQVTVGAAQTVRRGVNEGIYDVTEFGRVFNTAAAKGRGPDLAELNRTLDAFSSEHGRYTTVYVVDPQQHVIASVDGEPHPENLDPQPPYQAAGMQDGKAGPGGDGIVIPQYAPMENFDGYTVVAEYDFKFLQYPLQLNQPGDAWVVNSDGRVVGSLGGTGPLTELPQPVLREVATRAEHGGTGALATGGSIDREQVVGYTPITGPGPSGQQGWSVVSSRGVINFSLPQSNLRRQGLLVGVLLALISAIVFGWIYIIVIRPLLRLQREAERIAYGDLARHVEVVRYDEIGLVARALERIRVLLIRRRITERRPGASARSEGDGNGDGD